ncbi:MAG: FtsW/RodA/SpoVE family cell cycle protein [Bacteroidales bacterium]|nr:FtsW/RodA/SpoVE family cell cycle protein [Bacteroidales bacterium]
MNGILNNIIKGDKVIWGIIFFLTSISLLAVYSSTGTLIFKHKYDSLFYYLLKHSSILFLGFILIIIFQNISIVIYNRLAFLLVFFSIILLVYTLVKGENINEASRWITIPLIQLSFQTSDFAKFSLIVFVSKFIAKYLPENNFDKKKFNFDFNILSIIIILCCGLIFPNNFSTSFILFITIIILLLLGKIKIKYILKLSTYFIITGAIIIGISLIFFKHKTRVITWKNRIESFIYQDNHENKDDTYQLTQAKIAIANGGIIGKGPGNSIQRNYLPHPYSDFIFAIIIEEYGLLTGILIILAYLILVYKAGEIVKKSTRVFPAFLALGLIIILTIQAFVHISVNIGLIPTTGQPLPLVSMGGTSIIFTSLSLGIILNISTYVNSKNDTKNKSEEKLQNNNEYE